jgi:peptidoglycan/xylan/chitin deacetylase (PgdA/CDA1 family)
MLTHRNSTLFLGIAFAAICLAWYFGGVSLWWLGVPMALHLGLVAWGSSQIGSGFFLPVKCQGTTADKVIALTFDDGPAAYTAQILDVLKRHSAPATFFLIGQRAEADVVRRMDREGHLVGNHSYSHGFFFSLGSVATLVKEMQDADHAIAAITGKTMRLFRPPYGVTNPNMARAIRTQGYEPIGWSIRSLDTVAKDEPKLLQKLVRALRPGAVILFHDTAAVTARILEEFLMETKRQGYSVVGLDTLLNVEPYK